MVRPLSNCFHRPALLAVKMQLLFSGSTNVKGTVSKEEVPGTSLNRENPEDLKVPELKLWLACRRMPTEGKKTELVAR